MHFLDLQRLKGLNYEVYGCCYWCVWVFLLLKCTGFNSCTGFILCGVWVFNTQMYGCLKRYGFIRCTGVLGGTGFFPFVSLHRPRNLGYKQNYSSSTTSFSTSVLILPLLIIYLCVI